MVAVAVMFRSGTWSAKIIPNKGEYLSGEKDKMENFMFLLVVQPP
jgi:hypothetical protein